MDHDTVNGFQDKVNAALLDSDWDTLDDLVSPDAVITGPKGYTIDRDEWLGVHRAGYYEQVRLDIAESEVRGYDGAGIRSDLVESECRFKGETIEGRFRVVQVWVADAGRPRLVALQYTTAAG